MAIIAEKPWSYVLFDDARGWLLTVAIGQGGQKDVSIRLSESEVSSVKSDKSFVKRLAAEVSSHPERFHARQILPAIWPRGR